MKYKILTLIGLVGSTVASLFGGWDMALQTLVIFMAIDWFTGGILLPGVFRKSPKSPGGALESRAGWKGLCRKGMTLFYVLIAAMWTAGALQAARGSPGVPHTSFGWRQRFSGQILP